MKLMCRFCSKMRSPGDLAVGADGRGYMCRRCFEWHCRALAVLQGGVPEGCQECGSTIGDLKEDSPFVEARMYVVPKDGIYQVLCKRCCDSYVAGRRDLYRGTKFGTHLNL